MLSVTVSIIQDIVLVLDLKGVSTSILFVYLFLIQMEST